jgi:cell division protein FtsA
VIYKSRIVGAVEIGTSKVTVLVGEVVGSRLNVVGLGEFPSGGVLKGTVVDKPAAGEATHRALVAAENSAGVRLNQVFLAQSGGHIDGFYHAGEVNVGGLEGRVCRYDIESALGLAKSKALPPDRCNVHYLRRPYYVDDTMVASPEDIRGNKLAVGVWHVHGDQHRIADNIHIIRNFNLPVSQLVLSGLASGNILTTPEERHHGVLVIDIGAGTTDYAYYRHGRAYVAGVVPVGGSHLTNDLSLGLRITESQADKIKTLHGRATVSAKDRNEIVWLNGDQGIGDRQFPRMTIEQITAARLREIFEIVLKKLGNLYTPGETRAGVVITGGSSVIPGLEDAAARVFEVPARIGQPRVDISENLRQGRYSTALGLLHQGLTQQVEESSSRPPGFLQKMRNVLDTISRF